MQNKGLIPSVWFGAIEDFVPELSATRDERSELIFLKPTEVPRLRTHPVCEFIPNHISKGFGVRLQPIGPDSHGNSFSFVEIAFKGVENLEVGA